MQAEESILDRLQRRELKWYDTSLEWKIVVGRRHRTAEGPQQSWKNQVTHFMRSRNMKEDMAEGRLF
jgi:hypothetical protein